MGEDLNTTAAPWKIIAEMWNTWFTPPSRVTQEESKQYARWLSEKEKEGYKVLLLGVTPEIREELAELELNTTCLDVNQEMIEAMNSVLKKQNPEERIINQNWLSNSLKNDSYDFVIGDAVLPNVSWEDRPELLKEVKRLLRPGGCFLTRAFCVPEKKPYDSLDDLLKVFSDREPGYQAALELVLELQILAYDPADHFGTFSKPKELLETLRRDNSFFCESENLSKLLTMVWDFWCTKFIDKVYVYASREEEERQYQKFFEISSVFEASDNTYSSITPMYLLKAD